MISFLACNLDLCLLATGQKYFAEINNNAYKGSWEMDGRKGKGVFLEGMKLLNWGVLCLARLQENEISVFVDKLYQLGAMRKLEIDYPVVKMCKPREVRLDREARFQTLRPFPIDRILRMRSMISTRRSRPRASRP